MNMKRKQKWSDKWREKKGWFTMVILLAVTAMFPIFLFFFVELNYYYAEKDQAQDIADNIASSAVRSLTTNLVLENGAYVEKYEIDDIEAQQVARDLFKENYSLNDDLSPTTHSHLRSDPILKVYTVNQIGEFTTDEGFKWSVTRPTVIVYTSSEPNGLFFNKLVTLQTYSVFEVEAIPGQTPPVAPSTPIVTIDRKIYTATFTVQGTSFIGEIFQDKVKGQTTYDVNLSDGTKGTLDFYQQRRATIAIAGSPPITGDLRLVGANQNDISGNHTFTLNGYPGTYNARFTFLRNETITTGGTPPPATIKNEYRFHKQYLTY